MKPRGVIAWTAAVLAAMAAPSPAQEARGPSMGFVVADGGIRPVLGVPGAAVIGPAADTGGAVSEALASPRADFVLVVTGPAREPGVWRGGRPVKLAGIPSAPDRMALSPEGTAAGFYYRGENRVLLVAGLPGAPSQPVSVPLPGPRPLREIAVSDDGQVVLGVEEARDGIAGAVVAGASGQPGRIALGQSVETAVFVPGSRDAVVAGGAEAVLVRAVGESGTRIPLWTLGLERITAAAVTRGGRRIFLAGAGVNRITAVALEATGQSAEAIECPCAPDRLSRMNEDPVYQLTGYTGGTVYLLDGAATPSRIVVASPAPEPEEKP